MSNTNEIKEKRKLKTPINFKFQLNEEQKEAKQKILDNDITIITGQAGSGKAQSIDSIVITPDGIKTLGQILPGDYIISENGDSIKVLNIFPQGKKDLYRITFSDGSNTLCCKEHLWNVILRDNIHRKINRNGKINKNHNKYITLSLEEIMKKGIKNGQKDKWFIPSQNLTKFNDQKVNINPYILGCLLGDGSIKHSTPEITNEDTEIIEYFQKWCDDNDLIFYNKPSIDKYGKNLTYSITSRKNQTITEHNTLTKKLREYKLMGTDSFSKFIPKQYLYNSEEIRVELLQGLMDTDGWIQINKFRTGKGETSMPYFCTVSEQLKNDFIFLIQSLGGICYVSEQQGKYKPKGEDKYTFTATNYKICINVPNNIRSKLFKLKRKQERVTLQKNIPNRSISSIEYVKNDEAVCILVDSPTHLYLTDSFIVTHNTLVSIQAALDYLFHKQCEKIIIARPTVTADEDLGFLPGGIKEKLDPFIAPIYDNAYRLYDKSKVDKYFEEGKIEIVPFAYMRGRNFSDAFIIVDEAQNITNEQMKLVISRLCIGSKMVIVGDIAQIDLKSNKQSGMFFLSNNIADKVKGITSVILKTNHRHPIIESVLEIYDNLKI